MHLQLHLRCSGSVFACCIYAMSQYQDTILLKIHCLIKQKSQFHVFSMSVKLNAIFLQSIMFLQGKPLKSDFSCLCVSMLTSLYKAEYDIPAQSQGIEHSQIEMYTDALCGEEMGVQLFATVEIHISRCTFRIMAREAAMISQHN